MPSLLNVNTFHVLVLNEFPKLSLNMHLIDGFWVYITYVVSYLTPSPFNGVEEQALFLASSGSGPLLPPEKGPSFRPPSGGRDSDFECDYSNMPGWTSCSTSENRSCWLKNEKTGEVFDINTDYENNAPIGITRTYYLNITDQSINADGVQDPFVKLFNNSYPGPWIEACWGDVCLYFPNTVSILCPLNLTITTDNFGRLSPSSSQTCSSTMVPVFIGMGFDN